MPWIVEADNGSTREFDSRAEAEQEVPEIESLGLTVVDIRREDTDNSHTPTTDGGVAVEEAVVEVDAVVDNTEDEEETNGSADEIDVFSNRDKPDVSEDPISWMPEHFVDVIEGVPAINRKGYAVLAEHYGISTIAEPVTFPSESDWEYAEFRAIATTPDGDEYSGYGSAHVERGDDKTLLGEMAETRAIKRATANATGVGMTAVSELQGSVGETDRGDGQ